MSKIILIDDQPIANFITRKLLEIEGIKEGVFDFTNPLEALKFLENQEESIVFLDLNMPEMTGWEFLDAITKKEKPHKIIILTSSTSRLDQEKAKSYPLVLDYVEKPLDRKKILNILPVLPEFQ